ncbi:hypothetical protein E2P81_ATG03292 [Venturia nashicola]|uniref:Ribosomal protein S21 n=1 Tax=Venturia nashicola TaxID=86259 RepID=A0A4Z1P6H0_9PEZI|nr:hypothetical protein E6O75_ATG03361 [Venturia nashicola]TLD36403.1 hypothetical protein E2P81_ATG03292 [Venturia nashicola]
MEIRRAAQSLFRSQSILSSTFLSASSPRPTTSFTNRALLPFTCHSCRQFSIHSRLQQDEYDPNGSLKGIQPISISAEKESGSSLDDLDKPSSWSKPSQQYPATYEQPGSKSKYSYMEDLVFPYSDQSTQVETAPRERVLTELPIRLSAKMGRTLDVDPGKPNDLGTKMSQLNGLVARNKIRSDFNKQKFHERGGMKRKRLKSERWRTRFKNEFRKTVLRVQVLRKKGW